MTTAFEKVVNKNLIFPFDFSSISSELNYPTVVTKHKKTKKVVIVLSASLSVVAISATLLLVQYSYLYEKYSRYGGYVPEIRPGTPTQMQPGADGKDHPSFFIGNSFDNYEDFKEDYILQNSIVSEEAYIVDTSKTIEGERRYRITGLDICKEVDNLDNTEHHFYSNKVYTEECTLPFTCDYLHPEDNTIHSNKVEYGIAFMYKTKNITMNDLHFEEYNIEKHGSYLPTFFFADKTHLAYLLISEEERLMYIQFSGFKTRKEYESSHSEIRIEQNLDYVLQQRDKILDDIIELYKDQYWIKHEEI